MKRLVSLAGWLADRLTGWPTGNAHRPKLGHWGRSDFRAVGRGYHSVSRLQCKLMIF